MDNIIQIVQYVGDKRQNSGLLNRVGFWAKTWKFLNDCKKEIKTVNKRFLKFNSILNPDIVNQANAIFLFLHH